MDKEKIFNYRYSAKDNLEVQAIRSKYLPPQEDKLDELKRLDKYVQSSGMVQSLSTGLIGLIIFGLGMCLAMQVLGTGIIYTVLGVLTGIVGAVAMIAAYPVYRAVFSKTKAELTPRILELTSELTGENNFAN